MDYGLCPNWICRSRDEKVDALRQFFNTNDQRFNQAGLLQNHCKYLFLIGEENTGKMHLVEKAAKEIYGENWTSKVYIRRDEGQKFPYKLHAHKVESSAKVIFITTTTAHWNKWVELYPTTKCMEFHEADLVEIPNSPFYMIDYTRLKEYRKISADHAQESFRELVDSMKQEGIFTEDQAAHFQQKIRGIITQMNIRWFSDFQASQVTNS
jgi:hypothetical protein